CARASYDYFDYW
nr:immunoglobulin heavy chain junction region [Mus musculus]